MTDFPPTSRDSYRFWSDERVRFADLDPMGHVNNNAFGLYFESNRLAFFEREALYGGVPGVASVVARICIDFLAELTYPATPEIGLRVTRIGGSSYEYAQGLFVGETCHATARTVSVLFDRSTRRSKPLDDTQKAILHRYL